MPLKNLYDFSAVGFVFGRRLHKELNVPVGMIQSTWGGTHAESWTKMSVMKNNPLYADVPADIFHDEWHSILPDTRYFLSPYIPE